MPIQVADLEFKESPENELPLSGLWRLGHHTLPSERLDAAYRAYELNTGSQLSNPLTADDRLAVRTWLIKEAVSTSGYTASWRNEHYIKPLIHADAGSKAGWLQQAPCLTCLPNEATTALPVSFSVRVTPFSAQALRSRGGALRNVKQKIRESMKDRLQDIGDWSDTECCVTIVAVMGCDDKKKDADNLVKGLLDALQGVTFSNDSSISHLSVHRFQHAGEEGHYRLSVRPTINHLSDVVMPELKINWLNIPKISVDIS